MRKHYDTVTAIMITVIIAVITLIFGCTTTKYIDRVHTEYKHSVDTLLRSDSILKWDSVIIEKHGDTIYHNGFHTLYKNNYIYKMKTDTIYKTDSIDKPIYIKKKQTIFQKVKNGVADCIYVLFAVLILLILYKIVIKK